MVDEGPKKLLDGAVHDFSLTVRLGVVGGAHAERGTTHLE